MTMQLRPQRLAASGHISLAVALIFLVLTLANSVRGKDNLRVAYEWKEIDFTYATVDERLAAIDRGAFIPGNVIPFGLEVYRSRLFVTMPRWRKGVPASLAYLDLNDTSTKSPALKPFPSWEAHSLQEEEPELVSPFRVRADRCGRLWVLDSRIDGVLGGTKLYGPAQLLVYDLHDDNLLRRYVFPKEQMKADSFFSNLAIEDADCENTFAYAADLGSPGLVVYSWQAQDSWRVQHNYFHPDPTAGNYSIDGIEFQWDDGLYGVALSKPLPDGSSTLYFHALSSTMEFSVNTAVLRNKTVATSNTIYREFKVLGSRGPNSQAGASFLDSMTGVLFYALPNQNTLACWETSNPEYTIESQDRIYTSKVEMVFPSDVKVDDQQRLWVMSNRLHEFMYDVLNPAVVNFRILTAPVKDAIKNTACDVKMQPLPEIIHKIGDILTNVTNVTIRPSRPPTQSGSSGLKALPATFLFALVFLGLTRK